MKRSDRVRPALRHQRLEGGAALRLDQRVLVPGFCRIDIELGRRDVVVAGQHHGDVLLQELAGMRPQPPEPVELVIEFRPGLRIAVRQIDAGDDDAVDGGLDVARLVILAVAGQGRPGQHRLGVPRQDGDAVPGLLPAPHRAVAGFLDRGSREIGVGRFQFLQGNDIGPGGAQPLHEVRQTPVDVVDVEGCDLHGLMALQAGRAGGRTRRAERLRSPASRRPCRPARSACRGWSALRSRSFRNGGRVRRP